MKGEGFDLDNETAPKKSFYHKNLNHLKQIPAYRATAPRNLPEEDKKDLSFTFKELYKLKTKLDKVPEKFSKAKVYLYNKFVAIPYMFLKSETNISHYCKFQCFKEKSYVLFRELTDHCMP